MRIFPRIYSVSLYNNMAELQNAKRKKRWSRRGSDNQLSKAEERKMESYDAGGKKIALDVPR